MKRFWLCAVTILFMCSLSNCDVCRSLCSYYVEYIWNATDCQGRGLNTTQLLHSSFPTTTQILYLRNNLITQLPEGIFSGLRNLYRLYLQDNAITQLPGKVFSGLTSLSTL
ncbi:PREDICTED: carboxypeptidase N subunit 2-like [Acropora digitifera]|uniref:carboxypeptidase N subunit 2-like n=1 Tax=Acropora digitifera TaxID=70779 RepID=UPI00077A48D0|nr:PREDICTED: carboxypeptidase N subunit 2-like [Acropora digitifera]